MTSSVFPEPVEAPRGDGVRWCANATGDSHQSRRRPLRLLGRLPRHAARPPLRSASGFPPVSAEHAGGINQREADVAKSFTNALDKIITLRPDVVLIAGDVFHTVRPTNPAILHAFTQFSRLMRELPEAKVVIAAGNHDLPRSSETTCILKLFEPLGISVADTTVRSLQFGDRGLTVHAIPDLLAQGTVIEPDPASKYNVLVAHGEVEGTGPVPYMGSVEDAPYQIPKALVESSA